MEHWQRRDLPARRFVYFWADGVYFSPRLDHDKQCILVIIGADEYGRKELLAIAAKIPGGYRESAQSWREVRLDLKRRGLTVAPALATGDGALGFAQMVRGFFDQPVRQAEGAGQCFDEIAYVGHAWPRVFAPT